mmetsp:Transcript_2605/g.3543  ORF Transcript_2605/g.3543 Transcript_2605/m.3543 type:complete len:381 (+) Transcript_2605:48-1190(+)
MRGGVALLVPLLLRSGRGPSIMCKSKKSISSLSEDSEEKGPPAKKAKKDAKKDAIERKNENPRIVKDDTSQVLKLLTMNVAGLRAVLDPEKKKLKNFVEIIRAENADIIFLNEHKLKTEDVDTAIERLHELIPEYVSCHFSCSTSKKGYSGVAVLSKICLADKVSYGFQGNIFPDEGRALTIDLGSIALLGLYVPNSGQKLERLNARVETWDRALTRYCQSINKPLLILGDLNVAHRPQDIHNMYLRSNFNDMCLEPLSIHADDLESQYTGLTALKKQAGLTSLERASFSQLLQEANLIDAFVHFHPQASGAFTYFSQRAVQNRGLNRGLRLDYVLASNTLLDHTSNFPRLLDAFILDKDPAFSDHVPCGCLIELPPPLS